MSLLSEIKNRFRPVLSQYADDVEELLALLKPSQDPRFGDYQLNCAMPLGKKLGRPPREIAAEIVERAELDEICEKVEIAGPGFVNLTLDPAFLQGQIKRALTSEKLGVEPVEPARTIVIDYSSPNVAKPMHVGHIRSTVIGDALARILSFLGHRVITDNHLGDWGTQFGMIIYGYKHFVDPARFASQPVEELLRIYRHVRRLMDHLEKVEAGPRLDAELRELTAKRDEIRDEVPEDPKQAKKVEKGLKSLERKITETEAARKRIDAELQAAEKDVAFQEELRQHVGIADSVLAETARLHAGDSQNLELWQRFMPYCRDEIQRVYARLNIQFDHEYGESHYQPMLQQVVDDLKAKGLATESEGAQCVFLEEFAAPMIVQKKDGAFLYSTTDLATIRFRMEEWNPDAILYVVDHRQSEHFEKLFAVARKWGYDRPEYFHVAFGTIMDPSGKPYKTRAGDTVGLEGLLDEAVANARQVVDEINSKRPEEERLSEAECQQVAETVGIGGLKYFDLSQHRASDYVFTYEKMLALKGDTAPYVQMSYARVRGIFRKGDYDPETADVAGMDLQLEDPAEKSLAVRLLRFGEALQDVTVEYKPNVLTNYLFELAQQFAGFFESCPVLKAETEAARQSRLVLCDLTARTIRQGLELLGIEVREKM